MRLLRLKGFNTITDPIPFFVIVPPSRSKTPEAYLVYNRILVTEISSLHNEKKKGKKRHRIAKQSLQYSKPMHIKEKKRERPPFLLADILTFVPFYTFHFVPLPHSVNPHQPYTINQEKNQEKNQSKRRSAPVVYRLPPKIASVAVGSVSYVLMQRGCGKGNIPELM